MLSYGLAVNANDGERDLMLVAFFAFYCLFLLSVILYKYS